MISSHDLGSAEPVVHLLDVHVERGRELRVPEPSLHLLDRLAVVQQQRAARLAKGVEGDALVVVARLRDHSLAVAA